MAEKELLTVNETYRELLKKNHLTNNKAGERLDIDRPADDDRPALDDVHDAFVYYFDKDKIGEDVRLSTNGDDISDAPIGYIYKKARFIKMDRRKSATNAKTSLSLDADKDDDTANVTNFYHMVLGESDMGYNYVEIFSLFDANELQFIRERANGINREKTALPARVYRKCMKSVREKLENSIRENYAK